MKVSHFVLTLIAFQFVIVIIGFLFIHQRDPTFNDERYLIRKLPDKASIESISIPFVEDKMSPLSLRKKLEINQPTIQDCHFCSYLNYQRVFQMFPSDTVTYADAILTTYRDGNPSYREPSFLPFRNDVVILANIDWHIRDEKTQRFPFQLEVVAFELDFISSGKSEMFYRSCRVSRMDYEIAYTVSVNCNIDFILRDIQDECFTIQIFKKEENDDHYIPILLEPLVVRHCEHHHDQQSSNHSPLSSFFPVFQQQQQQQEEEEEYNIIITNNNEEEEEKEKEEFHWNQIALHSFIYQKNLLFLIDWIEHHLMIGFDHLFIYVHIGVSLDVFEDLKIFNLLNAYVEDGVLTMFFWDSGNERPDQWSPKAGEQRSAMNDCFHRYGYKFEWMAFFDDDEYVILPPNINDIHEIFNTYRKKNLFSFGKGDEEISNLFLYPYIFSNRRVKWDTNNKDNDDHKNHNHDEVIGLVYPEFDEIVNSLRKVFIKPSECLIMDNHNCAVKRNQEVKPLHENIMNFYDGKMNIQGWKFAHPKKELFLAHYYYKKYHYRNPVIFQKDIKIDQQYLKETESVLRLATILRKRVQKKKEEFILRGIFTKDELFQDSYSFEDTILDPRNFSEFRLPHFSKHWCEEEYGGSENHKNCHHRDQRIAKN